MPVNYAEAELTLRFSLHNQLIINKISRIIDEWQVHARIQDPEDKRKYEDLKFSATGGSTAGRQFQVSYFRFQVSSFRFSAIDTPLRQ